MTERSIERSVSRLLNGHSCWQGGLSRKIGDLLLVHDSGVMGLCREVLGKGLLILYI